MYQIAQPSFWYKRVFNLQVAQPLIDATAAIYFYTNLDDVSECEPSGSKISGEKFNSNLECFGRISPGMAATFVANSLLFIFSAALAKVRTFRDPIKI